MLVHISPSEIPVLLLFGLDPSWSRQEQDEVFKASYQLAEAISSVGHPTTPISVEHSDLRAVLGSYDPLEYIVFNWCEGLPGISHSEWIVTKYLEEMGFTFTGAGSGTLALTQNKYRTKQVLDDFGIPTPGWKLFHLPSVRGWGRFPAIVKPVNEHCSEGIDSSSIVVTERELEKKVRSVIARFGHPALVEDFIDGRELHVSLWGNGTIDVLPPVEMDFSFFKDFRDRICSYEAKFIPDSVHYRNIGTLLPAPLTEDELRNIRESCLAAYQALGCRDYARIDLRMKDGALYILDVNPNSDITMETSTIAAAEYAGYSYGEFGSWLVRMSAERHPVWGNQPL